MFVTSLVIVVLQQSTNESRYFNNWNNL